MKLTLASLLVLVLVSCASPASDSVVINNTAVPPVPTLNASQTTRGETLYVQYCAGCHGAKLEGAPNWKQRLPDGKFPAPPHDSSGHTWHHRDEQLIQIMRDGSDPALSSMPSFKDTLTRDDMIAILEFFKSKWGKDAREFQWWVTKTYRP